MKKIAVLLWNLILIPPVFAGEIIQQDIPTFTDQDLEKYKKISEPDVTPHDRNKTEMSSSSEDTGIREGAVPASEDKISESEKKSIEQEFNRIVAAMISQLRAGNIEAALAFFVESRKDKHRQIFKALKDNNTLKAALEGYMGVEIRWVSDHLAECELTKKENGEIFAYPINLMETAKGVWKIYDF
ncbi:MAG TPA: hypothetical protein VMU21_10590 [Thermodesulfovibrionales bacterium]|nr:hypothetical protein [Thermodesulfovibrionales bacterium]